MTQIRILLAFLFLSIGAATPGLAQMVLPESADTASSTPETLNREQARDLVSRMSDSEVRQLLLERLDAVADAKAAEQDNVSGGLANFARMLTVGAFGEIVAAFQRLPILLSKQGEAFATFYARAGSTGLLIMLVLMGSGIAAGLLMEQIVTRLMRGWLERAAAAGGKPDSLLGTVKYLGIRFLQDVLGVVLFFLVARWVSVTVAVTLFDDRPEVGEIVPVLQIVWLNLIVLPRLAWAVSRFVLAPRRQEYRLVHTDDATARYLHRNQIGLVLLIGVSVGIVAFNAENGVPMGETRLGFWLNMAVHVYIGWIAWSARAGLAMMMRGAPEEATPADTRIARAYPWFAIAVAAGMWWVVNVIVAYGDFALLTGAPHYTTMFLLLMAPALDTLVRGLVRHLVPPMTGEGEQAEAAYHATKRSFIRIGRVIVFAVVIVLIMQAWGISISDFAAASVGARLAAGIFEAVFILAFGYLVWEVVSLLINRRLAAEKTVEGMDQANRDEMGAEGGGGAGRSRLSTVLPLLSAVLKAAIAIMFGLIALGALGINTAPLLAGAGIIGLAIGFGAQKLVSDIVSGVFFLIDDAFRVGEYVEVGSTKGTVERISIRSMQLRHHLGPVHTLPYGEIAQITNYSRDWVIMKLKFTVPFQTDPNQVKKIFKKIGQEMAAIPEFQGDLMEPFKSQGVFDFDDRGMIVRGKFMTKPGKQFVIRKETYNRVKRAFEEAGIPFARREVQVAIQTVAGDAALSAEDQRAVAAAASEAARTAQLSKG
ncbi:MAG: mechanosensitive ion channel family protein [Pseudomonadota bacterium]